MPKDSTYYKDMQISPEVQLARDKESLALLLREKVEGDGGDIRKLLVNVSKNPAKVLYKDKGIEGEIDRRKIIMASLQQQIQQSPTPSPSPIVMATNETSTLDNILQSLSSLFNRRN